MSEEMAVTWGEQVIVYTVALNHAVIHTVHIVVSLDGYN